MKTRKMHEMTKGLRTYTALIRSRVNLLVAILSRPLGCYLVGRCFVPDHSENFCNEKNFMLGPKLCRGWRGYRYVQNCWSGVIKARITRLFLDSRLAFPRPMNEWMKVQWFKVHSKAKSRLSLTHLSQYNRWAE